MPARLRACLDATPLVTLGGQRSGVGTFVAGALEALAGRDDLEVVAFALTFRGRAVWRDALPAGVRPVGVAVPARLVRTAWLRTPLPPFEWFAGRAHVVHGTNFVAPPVRRGAVVVTVHDLTPVRFPEMVEPAAAAYPALVRAAVGRGAWVHTPSRFVADEVIELLGVPADRVVAVPHGTPAATGGDPARGRLAAGAERYVLAIGTVEPRKAYPDLVRAFAPLAAEDPELRLVVIGRMGWGSGAFARAVAELAPETRERVRTTGWLPDGARDDLLAGAAVLAYPSRYEGFGLPPLEAMAAGVPVVATDAGSLPEVLAGAATLVPVGDVDALAGALQSALGLDAAGQKATVEAGRRHAASYTWAGCAEGLAALYARAAGA
ncbi:MAG: glycosyltransferase family 1 protein [Acidimicrobiales bacterium]